MKKFYIFLLLLCTPFLAKAVGCLVQVQTTNVTCFGGCDGSAMAFPSGGGPHTFIWAPGGQTTQAVAGLCAGSYTVTVIDGSSCTATAVVTITEPPQLIVTTSATNASCSNCCDGFILSSVTGGTPGYVYSWNTSPQQNTSTAQAVCPGTYTLCVTDANGCSICTSDSVSFSTGIQHQVANSSFTIFPNPASQTVNIRQTFVKAVSAEITLTNMLGQAVYSESKAVAVNLDISLNISDLPNGVYFVTIKTATGNSVKRLIKQ